MVDMQEQLLDLVEEFYATLLLQDNKAILAVDEAGDNDDSLTLYVSCVPPNKTESKKVIILYIRSCCLGLCEAIIS